jgi:triosephosphate isomerase
MRTPVVAANWKMHKLISEGRELAADVAEADQQMEDVEFILSPTYVSLPALEDELEGTDVGLAAQSVHWKNRGAFTGEVSPPMLVDAGATHAIVGHSERREFFGETDATVNKRTRAAIAHGLKPIICVGESIDERQDGVTDTVVELQVRAALTDVDGDDVQDCIIAYEPLWAIGTGESASPQQAQSAHRTIRGILRDEFGDVTADATRIVYGGSVKPHNIDELIEQPDLDGALIGSASLSADSFLSIGESVQAYID